MLKVKNHTKIFKIASSLWYFIWGNLLAFLIYDRKYLNGKWFSGKYGGVGAIGWKWVCISFPFQAILKINAGVPWPCSPHVIVGDYTNIHFHNDDLNNFQTSGTYYQAAGAKLIIGRGTWIAPNVGLITQNHDVYDPDNRSEGKNIILGNKCWIGMNAVILPGVVLGDHTVVGAGAVVTKSFPEGHCVIAGNPAKIIKTLNK